MSMLKGNKNAKETEMECAWTENKNSTRLYYCTYCYALDENTCKCELDYSEFNTWYAGFR